MANQQGEQRMEYSETLGPKLALVGRGSDLAERAILRFVNRAPGWLVVAVALILYPGLALVLPLSLNVQRVFLVEANCVGAVLATVVGVGWLTVRIQQLHRRHLVEWTTNLRLLNSEEFEWLVGELLRREGWEVEETGQPDRPDGNIDLELRRFGVRRIVQCKRWASWRVDVDEIRKFLGTLMRESLTADAGLFVTLSTLTEQARSEATAAGLQVIEGSELYALLERHKQPEPCPLCSAPMLLDKSPLGWWFRCVQNGCSGKRDLGDDPERAVELLTSYPQL